MHKDKSNLAVNFDTLYDILRIQYYVRIEDVNAKLWLYNLFDNVQNFCLYTAIDSTGRSQNAWSEPLFQVEHDG